MKTKIIIAIFASVFLGLFLLLRANEVSADEVIINKSASTEKRDEIREAKTIDQRGKDAIDEDAAISVSGQPAIPDSILEICKPAPLTNVSELIVRKKAYIVSYNKDTKIPNWVAWCLTGEHTDGPVGRSNSFYEDESVPAPRATLEDYKRSGWSRGHMCPAGDNKWDEEAMEESFSLINVCPQNASLNSGLWNSIEMDCRQWAKKFGELYIVCGPVFYRREHEMIGMNKVYVPEAFFKVILCLKGKPKAFGIVVKNNSGEKKRDLYYNSIDQVERITGIDFFPSLPDEIENEVEANLDMDLWRR